MMNVLGKLKACATQYAILIAFAWVCLASIIMRAEAGDIIWENQGLTSGAAYTSGTTHTSGDVTMTTTWSTVTDGGTFNSGVFADFVTYQAGTTGNHSGLLLMSMTNSLEDPDDKLIVDFNFDIPIQNLAFTLLDIDDHSLDDLDDFVEVYYHTGDNNWVNLANQTSLWSAGSLIHRDNESFGEGWESDNNSRLADTSTAGNLSIDFGTTTVAAVRIRYFFGDDEGDPDTTQYVGISDMTFDDPADPMIVTSTADTNTVGTLRYAINWANANAADDDITFNISGTGPHVIAIGSGLPTITDSGVTIDGTTQSGASCGDLWSGTAHTLMVELDGPGSGYGITTSAADTTIKGLSITDFQIGVVGAGSDSNLTIQCNYLGLNPDGTSAGNTGAGTAVLGSSSLIGGSTAGQGNVISGNYYGVLSENGASAVTVTGNFIGTDPSGISARANTWGINNYTGSVTYAEISNNLISGNSDDGIFFDSGDTVSGWSGDLVISGNYIGVNRTGTSALANGGDGIAFDSSNVTGITIGGTSASDRNIISGNTGAGLSIINSSDIDVFGNYIGLNVSGTGAVGNSGIGIYTSGANSLNIGNGASSGRNVIAGNGDRAIQPRGTFSNLAIDGNYIGTDSTGNTALTNGANVSANIKDAISIDSGASVSNLTITDNVIGGYSAALIEFWGASADTVVIQGNSLGVGADGSSNIASSSIEAALYLGGGTMNWSNFTIGGTDAGEGNIIANGGADGIEISTSGTGISIVGNSIYSNTGDGIELLSGTGISIRQNSIYSNTGLGIDLGTDGTTANDDGDADSGVNDLQNFPVLNTLEVSSTSLTYDLNLNAASNSNGYRIEFFISDAGSASGYGEGQTYVGYLDVAGTFGDQNYAGTLTMTQPVSGGAIITATVTAKTASGYGSTSEFAANVEAADAADPLIVTSTADTNTLGTLRYAMNYANANSASDSISFNISGTGPFTITIASDLPTITDADVSIDGSTQSGASCGDLWSGTTHTLMIELDGPGSGYGITTTASNTTIKGLSITDFQVGVLASVGSASTVIQCNYIGLNPDGTAAGNTGVGVTAVGADLLIGGLTAGEGNVISSNPYGVLSYDGSTGTTVRGNFIGTDPTGSAARANTYGINNYSGTVTWSDITENLISGNSNEAIVFDSDDTVTGSSGDFLIQGNYIGLNRSGTGSLSNGLGVSFQGGGQTGITIGGTTSSDRNVIGGNSNQGIYINNASDIDIYGNYIGLTADGLTEIINGQHGIWLYNTSSINVGNGAASGRNVIGSSANRAITLESTANSISINGNYVGTDVTGNTPLTNAPFTGLGQRDAIGLYGTMNSISILNNVIGGFDEAAIESWGASGSGVTIQGNYLNVGADGSSDISTGTLSVDNSDYSAVLMLANSNSFTSLIIGGTGSGEGNIIANGPNVGAYIDNSNAVTFAGNTVHSNVSHGVRINGTSSTSVSLLQNSIYSNGGVGIDLGTDGLTANDSGDSDTGPNNLLNFPVLNGLYGDGTTSLRYEFTLDAPANTEGYRIEFFKTSVVNGTGYGDAETYVGALETGAHAGGSVDYSGTFTTDIAVSPDDIITVTATSKTGASSYGATSELALNNTMIAPYDYSDSPQTGTSYGTARHDIYSGFYLGSGVTGELAAYDSADASADTDDGTTLPSFSQSAAGTIDITLNGTGGYLQAWIDWNGDGDFLDTVDGVSEVLATDVQDGGAGDGDGVADGNIQIAFSVPPTATTSQTFARFRWSSTSGLDSTTDAGNGEVEDYAILISGNALLTASRSVAIYDPTSAGLYAVPGNDIVVTISATNIGGGASDTDSIEFIDEVPSDITFYNGTTSSFGGAVVGWTESSTGLSFTVSSDVAYSNSGTRPATFADCTYTPSAGYDANVRYVCFNPKGQMAAGDPDPTFSVQYRAQIN